MVKNIFDFKALLCGCNASDVLGLDEEYEQ